MVLQRFQQEKEQKQERLKLKMDKYKSIMESNNKENVSIMQDFERKLDSQIG